MAPKWKLTRREFLKTAALGLGGQALLFLT